MARVFFALSVHFALLAVLSRADGVAVAADGATVESSKQRPALVRRHQSSEETEESAAVRHRKDGDKRMFKEADADGNGKLDEGELKGVLTRANIPQDRFDWRYFDHDKDGQLSESEFVDAGPTASLIQRKEAVREEDERVFNHADQDGSGFLEESEIEFVTDHARIPKGAFDWRAFDADKDGRLSEAEFLAAGPAAAAAAKRAPLSLLQEYVYAKKGASGLLGLKKFEGYDADKSSFLEKDEAEKAMVDADLDQRERDHLDHDGDGKVSKSEFGMTLDEANKMRSDQHAITAANDKRMFEESDLNKDSFLEEDEVQDILAKIGMGEGKFDWHDFDLNGDARLSEDEFIMAGPAAAKAAEAHRMELANSGSEAVSQSGDSLIETEDEDTDTEEEGEEDSDAEEDGEQDSDAEEEGEAQEEEDESYEPQQEWDDIGDEPSFLEKEELESDHGEEGEESEEHNGSLTGETEEELNERVGEDFLAADTDGDGFLEEEELKNFMEVVDMPQDFDWRKYDYDKDGKLSKSELTWMARGTPDNIAEEDPIPSLLEEMDKQEHDEEGADESASLIEDDESDTEGSEDDDDIFDKKAAKKDFQRQDVDKSGFLEANEIKALLREHGVPKEEEDSWHDHDTNQDGKLSQSEMIAFSEEELSPLGKTDADDDDSDDSVSQGPPPAGGAGAVAFPEQRVKKDFQKADKDRSGSLEASEIQAFLDSQHVTAEDVNWRDFDKDKDGKLSKDEFIALAKSSQASADPAMSAIDLNNAEDGYLTNSSKSDDDQIDEPADQDEMAEEQQTQDEEKEVDEEEQKAVDAAPPSADALLKRETPSDSK